MVRIEMFGSSCMAGIHFIYSHVGDTDFGKMTFVDQCFWLYIVGSVGQDF